MRRLARAPTRLFRCAIYITTIVFVSGTPDYDGLDFPDATRLVTVLDTGQD